MGQDLLADLGLLQRSITVQCSESSLTAGECLRSTRFSRWALRGERLLCQQMRSFSSSHLTGTIGEIQTVVPVSRATDSRYLTVIVGGLDLTNSQTYKSCVE